MKEKQVKDEVIFMEEDGVSKISREEYAKYFNGREYISIEEYTKYMQENLDKKLSLFYHFSL